MSAVSTKTPGPITVALPEPVSDKNKAAVVGALSEAWKAGAAWGKAAGLAEAAEKARLKVELAMVRQSR